MIDSPAMRALILLTLLVACGTAPPPASPDFARSLDEISDEKQKKLVQGEQLYRADDPAFDSLRDELASMLSVTAVSAKRYKMVCCGVIGFWIGHGFNSC